jgi:poly-gamma-glutamate synthase PgsB/CapB
LRQSGHRVVAKTNGSKTRFILPDGTEEPVIRLGTPNICEQIDVLDRARHEGADVIVMECMAIRPDLQKVCEENIMRSTIGVITNVRPDHLDVMGPTINDVAIALSSTIPRNGKIISGDARFAPVLRQVADERGSEFVLVEPVELSDEVMRGFSYVEHEENVATALAVTRLMDVPDDLALLGMHTVIPDAGACTRWHLQHKGRPIEFLNVFAANDLESTVAIWQKLALQNAAPDTSVALLNLRGDRVDRSLQFAEAVGTGLQADYYVLVGDLPESVLRRFQRQVPTEQLVPMGRAEPSMIFDRIAQLGGNIARVGGIGNMGGLGHEILEFISRERSTT